MNAGTPGEWFVCTKRADFRKTAAVFNIDPVTARILRNRDLVTEEEIRRFLNGSLDDLYAAEKLPSALPAAVCLAEKIRSGKRIRIVGDYDIDGVCAAYILFDGLKRAGAEVDYRIPERVRDGYGISMGIVRQAAEDGIDTLLTCDNGISASEKLAFAGKNGMTVLLTDHHDIRRDENGRELLPPADFIVSAKLESSEYPEKEICGAVTAWKLLQLVYRCLNRPESEWLRYLEFAAVATIGDVMELRGENRIIAREGLAALNRAPFNPGLAALIRATGLAEKKISSWHIGFVIGPCINAGGRLETAETAMRLFLAEDGETADRAAAVLTGLNESRKLMTQKGTEEAVGIVQQQYPDDRVLVILLEDLHESLAGIVAGRLKETFGRPAFVLTPAQAGASPEKGRLLKGSGRSVEAWDMFRGISEQKELLQRFGGHPMAAGLSLYEEDLALFRKKLNDACGLSERELVRKIWIDVPLPMSYLTERLVQELELLEPFGNGNEKPLFAEKDLKPVNLRVLGKNRNVLRMDLLTADGFRMPAVMFEEADSLKKELEGRGKISVLYYPQINEYGGYRSLQVQVEAFR